MEDWRLLREYAENGSETSFTSLVNRHLALVYSAAFRRLGDAQVAEEITQSVFCLLARKARRLDPGTVLAGWLHRAVCLATAKYWRTERRRQRLDQEAASMMPDPSHPDATWEQLVPHLDDAMNRLEDEDRLAVLLRYFQAKPFHEVGSALGITEDAARMRVHRALERLRSVLQPKRISCTSAALGTLLVNNAIEAVPVAVAGAVRAAVLRVAAVSGTPPFLAALITLLAGTKLKTAAVAGMVALTVAIGLRLRYQSSPHDSASVAPFETAASAIQPAAAENPDPVPQTTPGTALRRSPRPPSTASDIPPSPTARQLYERGMVHQRQNRESEALADFTKSIELLDQGIGRWEWFTEVYFARANLYAHNPIEAKRDYAKAIADYTRMLEFEPKLYSPRFNRALNYHHLRQYDNAIADYTQLLEDPETDFSRNGNGRDDCMARAYEYRGRVHHDRKDYASAIADFTSCLGINSSGGDNMEVYWRRGLCYRSSQQLDKALEDANHLSNRALKWATAQGSGDADRDKARTAARFGSEIFEHKQSFHLEVLAATHAKAGDFRQAVSYQERALEALSPAAEAQRPAMLGRLDLYQAGKRLGSE